MGDTDNDNNNGGSNGKSADNERSVPYRRERAPSIVVQSLGLSFSNRDSNFDSTDTHEGEEDDEERQNLSPTRQASSSATSNDGTPNNNNNNNNININNQENNQTVNESCSSSSSSSASSPFKGEQLARTRNSHLGQSTGSLTPPAPLSPSSATKTTTSNKVPTPLGARRQSLAVDGIGAYSALPANEGNATGSLRNKVALKPGHSLMGWIRLVDTAKDLSGTGGKLLEVSTTELAKHNKLDDCWIALKGNVYNVTLYLNYHPGGIDQLMRAAGQDATELFNEIHRWVNYEAILAKCLVGRYRHESPSATNSPGKNKFIQSSTTAAAGRTTTARRQSLALPVVQPQKYTSLATLTRQGSANVPSGMASMTHIQTIPTYVISQDKSNVRLEIQVTHLAKVTRRNLICDVLPSSSKLTTTTRGQRLHISVILSADWLYCVHLRLCHSIDPQSVTVRFSNGHNSSITLSMTKSEPKVWMPDGRTSSDVNDLQSVACNASAICTPLSLDDSLCEMTLSAWHVLLRECCQSAQYSDDIMADDDIAKPDYQMHKNYTPVISTFNDDNNGLTEDMGFMGKLYFIIKIYPNGELTPKLNTLKIGDYVDISDYQWNDIDIESVAQYRSVWLLLAAGTGLTPMIRTIAYLLSKPCEKIKNVKLLFFNRTQQDMVWHDEFARLQERHSGRFQCEHILSDENSDQWTGAHGHVNIDMLAKFIDCHSPDDTQLLACGPRTFTQLVRSLVSKLNLANNLHIFHG
ncbi:Cytochrome b5 reductase 4, partial [Fragariocoptes setiger]